MNNSRIQVLKAGRGNGPVVYWMSRDQRIEDNWAMSAAADIAHTQNQPLLILFNLLNTTKELEPDILKFMINGLLEQKAAAKKLGIHFLITKGNPITNVQTICEKIACGTLVTDFSPLRATRKWQKQLTELLNCQFLVVDAHNIVPVWIASNKQEIGARTLRPKINKLLPEYLTPLPQLANISKLLRFTKGQQEEFTGFDSTGLKLAKTKYDEYFMSGTTQASKVLDIFISKYLNGYEKSKNHPELNWISQLSPYLHFGQLSAQRVAVEVMAAKAPETDKEAFLEELIIRRELSDNFCYYNENYDNTECFYGWAKQTLEQHHRDPRPYTYSLEVLEQALTHDEAWNASQVQMMRTGKMHGYMRMYWAKKILEWTPDAHTAQKYAIYLNDRYELDGRDPNGYTGIAWSMGGIHDRPWKERNIFGKIRYMNYAGLKRKFDIEHYISITK